MTEAEFKELLERADVQRLLDERAISAVMVRYIRGIDRGDSSLIAQAFHPDAIDHHGPYEGQAVPGFVDWVLSDARPDYLATMHYIQNMSFDFVDDVTAYVETYLRAVHVRASGEVNIIETFGGRYADRFEKRDDEWKIAERTVILDWSDSQVSLGVPRWRGLFTEGHRGPADFSYQR
jgi:SnoaL-like domain